MKVVVIKSPKFLSGILRMIFKINKDEEYPAAADRTPVRRSLDNRKDEGYELDTGQD